MNIYDDEPKHKKKAKHNSPKKADHKHNFIDCIFEYDDPHGELNKEKGFVSIRKIMGGSYCLICGKINDKPSFKWRELVRLENEKYFRYILSERAKIELNPETRTLPTFYIKDRWKQKFIDLNNIKNSD